MYFSTRLFEIKVSQHSEDAENRKHSEVDLKEHYEKANNIFSSISSDILIKYNNRKSASTNAEQR